MVTAPNWTGMGVLMKQTTYWQCSILRPSAVCKCIFCPRVHPLRTNEYYQLFPRPFLDYSSEDTGPEQQPLSHSDSQINSFLICCSQQLPDVSSTQQKTFFEREENHARASGCPPIFHYNIHLGAQSISLPQWTSYYYGVLTVCDICGPLTIPRHPEKHLRCTMDPSLYIPFTQLRPGPGDRPLQYAKGQLIWQNMQLSSRKANHHVIHFNLTDRTICMYIYK